MASITVYKNRIAMMKKHKKRYEKNPPKNRCTQVLFYISVYYKIQTCSLYFECRMLQSTCTRDAAMFSLQHHHVTGESLVFLTDFQPLCFLLARESLLYRALCCHLAEERLSELLVQERETALSME